MGGVRGWRWGGFKNYRNTTSSTRTKEKNTQPTSTQPSKIRHGVHVEGGRGQSGWGKSERSTSEGYESRYGGAETPPPRFFFSTSDWLQIGHWVVQHAERSANRGPEGSAGWKARGRSLGGPLSPPPGSGEQVVVFLKGQYAMESASPSFQLLLTSAQMPKTLLTCALEGAVEHVALLPELP